MLPDVRGVLCADGGGANQWAGKAADRIRLCVLKLDDVYLVIALPQKWRRAIYAVLRADIPIAAKIASINVEDALCPL